MRPSCVVSQHEPDPRHGSADRPRVTEHRGLHPPAVPPCCANAGTRPAQMSCQRHLPQDSIMTLAEADPLLQHPGANGAGAQVVHRGVGMNIVLLIFVAAAAAIGFSIAGVWLGRCLLRGRVAAGHHEVVLAFLQTGGTLHAVFLAFLVVAVWQSYDAARANVADEASALATLYRASTGMEAGMENGLRKLIRNYADAVIHD